MVAGTSLYRVITKSLCTWLSVFEQSTHNWWFQDGHHKIHSECGRCYTEHCLWKQFGVSINVWRLAGNTLNKIIYATKCFYKFQYTHTTCLIRSYVHQTNLTVQQEEDSVSTESKVKGGFHYLALEIMNTSTPKTRGCTFLQMVPN